MLGRKREDQSGAKPKKRKWEESEDDSGEEKVTPAEMEAWREKMQEEEKKEQERERAEQEARRAREAELERQRMEKELQRQRELEREEQLHLPPAPPPADPGLPEGLDPSLAPPELPPAELPAACGVGAALLETVGQLGEDGKRQLLLQHLMQAVPQQQPDFPPPAAMLPPAPPVLMEDQYAAAAAAAAAQAQQLKGFSPPQEMPVQRGFSQMPPPQVAMHPQMGGMQMPQQAAPGPPLPNTTELVTIHFQVPMHRLKDILGVKGKNVKAIKQQSGVQKIGIMDGVGNDPATVEIIGMASAVDMARSMVLGIVAGDHSVIGNVVEALDIEQHLVSKLIGPKGSVISNIKDQSGAYLAVREQGAGLLPKVVMTGPPDCVARARLLVVQFLAEQRAVLTGGDAGHHQQHHQQQQPHGWWPELGMESSGHMRPPQAWPRRPPMGDQQGWQQPGMRGGWQGGGPGMGGPGMQQQQMQHQMQMQQQPPQQQYGQGGYGAGNSAFQAWQGQMGGKGQSWG